MARHLEAGAIVADKYKLIERLGGGGMGDVYRAEHMLAGRLVALKVLRADFADNEDLTRRFFMEAQAVNKIRHPNIVDVIDAGFSREGPYVVMECLEGTSLAQALSRLGRLDVPTALAVVLPTLSALDAAHRNVIVHRDLKPENIYLAEINGEVRIKLLDFGIAKVADKGGAAPRTSTGVVFGTPDYLSPEQANGEGDVDGRSDIFAIGTVLFELITGRRPFEAPTAVATAYKIVHLPAPTLAAMGHEVNPLLQTTLDIALAKDRTDRFASAADFADALAPITPHGAIRRQALATLLVSVLARQSTQAAPIRDTGPESVHPAPAPAPKPGPPKVIAPIAPTLVSSTYTPPGLRPAPLREPIISETPASRAPWPSASRSHIDRITPMDRLTPIDRLTPADRVTPASMPPSQRPPLPSRARAWTPRPLPASSRGRCHVRGTLPRAICRWIRNVRGVDKRDEVLAMLPRELAEMAQTDSFNALVWYDLENVDSLVEAGTLVALSGDPMAWRALAKENFERDLGPIFRPSTRTVDPDTLLRRMPSVWSRLFDFGSVRVNETARRVTLRIENFDAASLAFRNVLLGTLEGMLQNTATLTVRVASGESSFARDFEVEFAW